MQTVKNIWNISEADYVMSVYDAKLPSIDTNYILYLPKTMPHITLESIKELYTKDAIDKIEEYKSYPKQSDSYEITWENKEQSEFYMNIDYNPLKFVKVRFLSNNFTPYDLK